MTPGLLSRWLLRLPVPVAAHVLAVVLVAVPAIAWSAFEVTGEMLGYEEDCPVSFMRVEIRNRTGEKVRCELEVNSYEGRSSSDIRIAPLEIEPDGERTLDIPVPMVSYGNLKVMANGRRSYAMLNRASHRGIMFLNIAEMGKWGSEKELDEFSRNWTDPGGYHGRHGSGSGAGYRVVSQLEPNRLPQNWLCYAPFRGVFCQESAWDRMSADGRAALMTWVDGGGHLTIYGSEKDENVRQMAGTIVYQSRNPLTFTSGDMATEWRRMRPHWQAGNEWRHATGASAEDRNFPFGVKEMGGKGGAFGLATAFLVLAGPVNYFYFRRKGQLRRLMISLPAISIGFCVLIMGFFVATQGFSKKGGSFAVSMLDETRGAGLTFTRHSVFSGLYPLGGFRFDSDSGFVPLKKAVDFSMSLGTSTNLESGIFQPTSNFHYQTLKPHTTREKLIHNVDERTVVNGFEKPLELVVLAKGDEWFSARSIAPAGKAVLERIPAETLSKLQVQPGERMLHVFAGELADWSDKERQFLLGQLSHYLRSPQPEDLRYMVSFSEGDPAVMQPGLKMDKFETRHVLMNVGNQPGKSGNKAVQQSVPEGVIHESLPL